jgi:AraC-like DNA-binding protein
MKTQSSKGGRHGPDLHPNGRYALRRAQPTVVTIVEPFMRSQIDCATGETISKVHVGTVREAAVAVREHAPRTILLSPAVVSGQGLPLLARLLVSSPGISAVALVGAGTGSVEETLLHLGACGVRKAIALTGESVWPRLRAIIGDGALQCDPIILTRILEALNGASPETKCFFVGLVRAAPSISTVRELAREMNAEPSTLMSRFHRAGLPAPRLYLTMTRLVYAASLLTESAVSIASVAYHLRFSSPQSFGRHLRTTLGVTAGEFRRHVTMQSAIEHLVAKLIAPHRTVFSTFKPLGHVSMAADRCNGRDVGVVA